VSLYLDKLLPLFVYPLGASILLGIAVLALSFVGFKRLRFCLLAVALALLWISSTPVFANWLIGELESEYPPIPVEDAPEADAIIVLGGIVRQPRPPRVAPDLSDSADRIVEALRLYRAGKAPVIVISAGNLPWRAAAAPEAELIAMLLVEFGAPRSALVLDSGSRNTRENALNTAALFRSRGWRTGLLVTSAAHMPRALAVFRKVGLEVVPIATDIRAPYATRAGFLGFLPNADALAKTTFGLKELIGLSVYRIRGWI
jgi:uncharacterized SAM-binding protein YcdF (DUF218 family)